MVTAEVRLVAYKFKIVLPENEDTTVKSLKSAEDLKNVFAIIGYRHSLTIGSNVFKLVNNSPGFRVNNTDTAVGWLGAEH